MHARFYGQIICFLFISCSIVTETQGATGEVTVTSPAVGDIVAVPAPQEQLEISGTYILTEDSTPDFSGAVGSCASGTGTFRPHYWEGSEPSGGPIGYYADLFYRVDQGSRHKIGSVRYGHAYRPGTEYNLLNTLLNFSFSVSLANLDETEPHEILIELVDIYSLYCRPVYWWSEGYEQKIYGDVITTSSIPFFIGDQTPVQNDHLPDSDPGGCHSKKNLVAID